MKFSKKTGLATYQAASLAISCHFPIEDAVATCVLSKRWENQWTSISTLDLTDKKLFGGTRFCVWHFGDRGATPLKRTFANFVYGVLQSRSLRPSKFRIKFYQNYDAYHVIAWITMVLRSRNIRELDVSVYMEKPVMLPWTLFTCEGLVNVKLEDAFVMDVPTSVKLHCLKVLCLFKVKLLDEDSISRLLGGCPVLEELSLRRCIGEQVEVVNIFVPCLTSLNLTCLRYDGVSRIKIVLKTPKLSYLVIDDNLIHQGYELKGLNYVNQARIDCSPVGEADQGHCESLNGLLEAVSKANSLEFGNGLMEVMVSCKVELPEFQNIRDLKLGYYDTNIKPKLLPILLQKMPCLTTLTFAEGLGYDEYCNERRIEFDPPDVVPNCLSLCLNKIEFMCFRGSKSEREIVDYFLENALVLEKLIIHYDLLEVPRASSICKVELI